MAAPLPVHLVFVEGDSLGRGEFVRNLRSNDAVVIRNRRDARIHILCNQRLAGIVVVGCYNCRIMVLDSAVISSRSLRLVDCELCEVIAEDVDIRRTEFFRCKSCTFAVVGDDILLSVLYLLTREGCSGNRFVIADLMPSDFLPPPIHPLVEHEIPDSGDGTQYFTYAPFPMAIQSKPLVVGGALTQQGLALQQSFVRLCLPTVFVPEDADRLLNPESIPTGDDLLAALASLEAAPYTVTPEQIEAEYDFERQEIEESVDQLRDKVRQAATLLRESHYCVVYTGAGISTSADVPDFRGPTGVWTLRDKGIRGQRHKTLLEIRPTYAHYAITELAKRGMVKFVVTTNVDGLHWRTGLPAPLLEELHGSHFTEFCPRCTQLHRRQFITYGDQGLEHKTGRQCEWCHAPLLDTMVAFCEGYRSALEPIITEFHARRADMALVLGTSMCVQSSGMYPMAVVGRGNLVVVNLQKTPVDNLTSVRCFCKTDLFCQMLMQELGIPDFDRETDKLTTKPRK